MVGLPRGKEHWETGNQSRKSTESGRAEAHCGCLQQAGQSAIERVDSMAVRGQHIFSKKKIQKVVTDSKSSPNPLDVPVRRACLPSTLSRVEYLYWNAIRDTASDNGRGSTYIHTPKAKL